MRHGSMMVRFLVGLALAGVATVDAHGNTRGTAKLTLGGKTVAIEYGRPSLQGRDMLSRAVVGQEWRMGADAATTLETTGTLAFGNVQVPPGTYVLKARKASETDWRLKFEKDDQAVAEVPLQSSTLAASVETLTIDLAQERGEGVFRMSWGTRMLSARFTAK